MKNCKKKIADVHDFQISTHVAEYLDSLVSDGVFKDKMKASRHIIRRFLQKEGFL
jgi:hypothetical protein